MQTPSEVEYRFGPFSLNPGEKVLLRQGKPVALTAKAFEILMLLVQNPGRSLAKEEMLRGRLDVPEYAAVLRRGAFRSAFHQPGPQNGPAAGEWPVDFSNTR